MDLEIMRGLVSIGFLLLLLWQSYRHSRKLEEWHYETMMAFRTMPRIAEATVEAQAEILLALRRLTKRLDDKKTNPEYQAPQGTNQL